MKKEEPQNTSLVEDHVPQLEYENVPATWAVCPNEECPRARECLRYHAYTLMPSTKKQRLSVMPTAWQSGQCSEYAEDRPQQLAWGMRRLFAGLPEWRATAIRHELYDLFRTERTYYRYRRGEYLITPGQQQQIADLFARYGVTTPPHYDYVIQDYYFPSRGFGTLHSYNDERTLKRLEEWKHAHRD